MTKLYQETQMGSVNVKNRVFMAPLTRNRADDNGVVSDLTPVYYAQRASGGLLISEATQISPQGKGYFKTPGIYNDEQINAWKKVTEAVHEKGGKIFLQLWHVGRISHASLQENDAPPVAPSAIRANSQTFTSNGPTDVSEPRALEIEEIKNIVQDYKYAAACAKKAGFDGVEIHSANGYLIDQFLQDKTNHRDDAYGGSTENRVRFLKEVTEAVLEVWDASNVGVRLSPTGTFNDMGDSDPEATFSAAIKMLNQYNLAYLHMVERFPGIDVSDKENAIVKNLRALWDGFYIANGDFDKNSAEEAIESGYADAIAFGRPFIANPDLPKRLKENANMNEPDQNTFYGGGAEGYTDYPFLDQSKAA